MCKTVKLQIEESVFLSIFQGFVEVLLVRQMNKMDRSCTALNWHSTPNRGLQHLQLFSYLTTNLHYRSDDKSSGYRWKSIKLYLFESSARKLFLHRINPYYSALYIARVKIVVTVFSTVFEEICYNFRADAQDVWTANMYKISEQTLLFNSFFKCHKPEAYEV